MIKESKFHQNLKLVSHSTIHPKLTTAKQNFQKAELDSCVIITFQRQE